MTNRRKRYIKRVNGLVRGLAKEYGVKQCRDCFRTFEHPEWGKEVNGEKIVSYRSCLEIIKNTMNGVN